MSSNKGLLESDGLFWATIVVIAVIVLGFYLQFVKKSGEIISNLDDEFLPVAPIQLPDNIASFMKNRSLRFPTAISKYCYFDFKSGKHPFFIQGDFDGDRKLDYAIHTNRFLFVLLGSGQLHEFGRGSYIYKNEKRGLSQTLDGPITLKYDSLGLVFCEQSSVLYVYDRQKNIFEKVFTSD